MIIDAELAVMTYLEANGAILAGGEDTTVAVTRREFHDDTSAAAVAVSVESGRGDEIPELNPVALRIVVRAPRGRDAFALMRNVDGLMDRQVRKLFAPGVECLGCTRNTAPQPLPGDNNRLAHYTCLYDLLLRRRDG